MKTLKKIFILFTTIAGVNSVAQNSFPSSGNAGVGTSTPTVPFEIGTTLTQGANIFKFGNPQQFNQIIFRDRSNSSFLFGLESGQVKIGLSGSEHKIMSTQYNAHNITLWPTLSINSPSNILINGQYVGVGNSNPQYKLDVNGNINATQYLVNGSPLATLSGTGNTLYLPTTASLGIGNANPQYPLDVNGDARITNNLYVGGGIIIADNLHATESVTTTTVRTDTLDMGNNGGTVRGDINATDKLNVAGNATFSGNFKNTVLAGTGERLLVADSSGNLKPIGGTGNGNPCAPIAMPWYLGGNFLFGTSIPYTSVGTCNNYPFVMKANNNESIFIQPNSFVGIGLNNSNPTAALDITDGVGNSGSSHFKIYGDANGYVESDTHMKLIFGIGKSFEVTGASIGSKFTILGNGKIGVGDNNSTAPQNANFNVNVSSSSGNAFEIYNTTTGQPEFRVKTNGLVYSREVVVQLTAFPDYVFANDYKLQSLESVENYIKINKHLPNVPPAKEIEKEGANLGELSKIQMEKTEELYLYMFELNRRVQNLEKENKELKEKLGSK